ncbi:MAG TPA: exosome complex exonuclease Rrp41 [Methanomassiliicoccales archaeon]|nr:exosome complex exonuclease Rrp41 [Methanomassiliicoccales archaeon]
MGGNSDMKLIDENGIRIDGRKIDEIRPMKIEAGVLKSADGSAYVEIGKNKVLAAVYGPRECHPRHMQNPAKAIVQCKYNMISFSVSDRKRPGPDRRSVEISKLISEAMEYVVFTENYPRTSIDVYIEVLQANAGTRCAGLVAASVALADAGIPMKDLVPAVAVGKVNDQVVLDLNKEEDNYGQADLPIAMIPRTGEVLLMQMDGHLTQAEFDKALEMGVKACQEIYDLQKDALRRRYAIVNAEAEEETREPTEDVNEEA